MKRLDVKKQIKRIIRGLGYRIQNVNDFKPVDLRKIVNDPRAYHYYSKKPVLINAKTINGRVRFLPLNKHSNPFTYSVSQSFNKDNSFEIIKSCLKTYYEIVQPQNILEWFDLRNEDVPLLHDNKVIVTPEPWSASSINQKKISMQNVSRRESKKISKPLDLSAGDKLFGPVTEDKLHVESLRLHNVLMSIKKRGWIRHDDIDGDIEATIFINELNEWRWQVSRGLHRVAVLSALEWKKIPVRVNAIVYRSDVEIWPNVLSGLYTTEGALKIFDRIFKGDLSPIFVEWVRNIEK